MLIIGHANNANYWSQSDFNVRKPHCFLCEEWGSDGSEECRNLCSVGKLLVLVNSPYVPPRQTDRQWHRCSDKSFILWQVTEWHRCSDICMQWQKSFGAEIVLLLLTGRTQEKVYPRRTFWLGKCRNGANNVFLSMGNSIEVILINDNNNNHRWLV